MKKILLIGDSIRMGYDKYVKIAFEDVAKVYYPEQNCRFTSYIIRYLFEWKKELGIDNVDLVHWNAGLWDELVMFDGKNLTSFECYKENIERICNLINIFFPGAKMIFATSTPVQEELYVDYKRYNKDIEMYNAAAVDIVKNHGGEINDLYTLASDFPASYHSDLTHYYTKEGTELFTGQVVNCIERCLGIKGKELDYSTLFREQEEIIGI